MLEYNAIPLFAIYKCSGKFNLMYIVKIKSFLQISFLGRISSQTRRLGLKVEEFLLQKVWDFPLNKG